MVDGTGTWDKHDKICMNGQYLNWLMTAFFKDMSWKDKCLHVFVAETNWREHQPFEVQVKHPWLKFLEPQGQIISSQQSTGAVATSLVQAQATIPTVFAAARTSSRGVSSNINSPKSSSGSCCHVQEQEQTSFFIRGGRRIPG